MRRAVTILSSVILASAGPTLASSAFAQPCEDPIRIEYDAPASCPTSADFFDGVQARAPRARHATGDGPAPTFAVTLHDGGSQSTGKLVVRFRDGTETEREVTGDSCAEVVSALSLVAALAIDPTASERAEASVSSPLITPPTQGPLLLAPYRAPVVAEAPRVPGIEDPQRWHLGVGFQASFSGGVASDLLFGVPVSVQVDGPATGLWALTLRLGFERTSSSVVTAETYGATYTWTAGFADACPIRGEIGHVRLTPCVRFEGGEIAATGVNVIPARERVRPWLAIGALLRGEWSIVGPAFIDVEAGLRFPMTRTSFFLEPNVDLFRTPAVGGIVSAGLGARFLLINRVGPGHRYHRDV